MPAYKKHYEISDDDVIYVAPDARKRNPKRLGTAAYGKFNLLSRFHGRTIGEFREAADSQRHLGQPAQAESNASWALGELRWCLDKGFISVRASSSHRTSCPNQGTATPQVASHGAPSGGMEIPRGPAREAAAANSAGIAVRAEARPTNPSAADLKANNSENVTTFGLFDHCLHQLSERERKVLGQRYGFDNQPRLKLEAIGQRFGVTRERIRQIESKAKRKLKLPKTLDRLDKFIDTVQADELRRMAHGRGFIPRGHLRERKRAMTGEFLCAIEAAHGNVEKWLDTVTTAIRSGWSTSRYSPDDISDWINKLRAYGSNHPLPQPLAALVEPMGLSIDQLAIAIECSSRLSEVGGYIVSGQVSLRKRRTIQAHALMGRICATKPQGIENILRSYHAHFNTDLCSGRDLDIVLKDAPHLFVNMYDFGWMPIGLCSSTTQLPAALGGDGYQSRTSRPKRETEATLVNTLHSMLSREGPMAFVQARDRFMEITGTRYSKNSVLPVLITNVDFVRMAPGVIGTAAERDATDKVRTVSKLLLRETQCRIYALAKAAGEPKIDYPLWTPAMEHAWCHWADESADNALFGQLLSIVRPETWPVSRSEKDWWTRKKKAVGTYHDDSKPLPLNDSLPELDHVYTVLMHGLVHGCVNWMTVNRTTGFRIDDRHSASILALLISAGVIVPTGGWRQSHRLTERAEDLAIILTGKRCAEGSLHWNMLEGLEWPISQNCAGTWVHEGEIADLIRLLCATEGVEEEQAAARVVGSADAELNALLEGRKKKLNEARILALASEGEE